MLPIRFRRVMNMLPIIDDRARDIRVESIVPGGFFIWNDLVFRRLLSGSRNTFHASMQIACELMTTGEVHSFEPEKMVEPIECELTIVND